MATDTPIKVTLELTNDEAHLLMTFAEHGAYAFGCGGTSHADFEYPKGMEPYVMAIMQREVEKRRAHVVSLHAKMDAVSDMLDYD